jgi:tetratricopeptide (TPR) repeat protein
MRSTFARWAGALALVLSTHGQGGAQQHSHAAAAPPAPRWLSPRELELPLPLREGIGTVHEPVTTASAEAQAYYDQGVRYLQSFGFVDAARSFRQALRADSTLAMAHLRLAFVLVISDDGEGGLAAFEQARRHAPRASAREQAHVALFGTAVQASGPDGAARYRAAVDSALSRFPDDPELWLARGNAEAGPFEPGTRTALSAIPFYKRALRIAPSHTGAEHFLVHAYENAQQDDSAAVYAARFADHAPQVLHVHHMLAHTLLKRRRVREARQGFLRADSLERLRYAAEPLSPALDWHRQHNLNMLGLTEWYEGRIAAAEKLLRESVQAAGSRRPVLDAAFHRDLPELLLASGRPAEALEYGRSLVAGSRSRMGRALGHAASGRAQVALGRHAEAAPHLAAAESLATVRTGYTANAVWPSIRLLRAELLLHGAAGRPGAADSARAELLELGRVARSATEPDDWLVSLFRLEAMARTARGAGEWALADSAARLMLEHDSTYAGTHYALGLAAERRGDHRRARLAFERARRLWDAADPGFPQLAELRRRLAGEDSPGRSGRGERSR